MIEVFDRMQTGYTYRLIELPGRNFHHDFRPQLTPAQMLALGVFGGQIHDGLPRRVSRPLVRESETHFATEADARS